MGWYKPVSEASIIVHILILFCASVMASQTPVSSTAVPHSFIKMSSYPAGPRPVAPLSYSPSRTGILVERTWGGNDSEEANGVVVDSTGNIYVTGETYSFGLGSPSQSALVLLKYSSVGTLLWQRIWSGSATGNNTGEAVAVDSQGSIYVTGYTTSFNAGNMSVALLKFDSSGSLLWQRTWGNGRFEVGNGIVIDTSDNVYISGTANLGNSTDFTLLLRFDSSGNLIWERIWSPPIIPPVLGAQGGGIAVDSSGMIYITGKIDETTGSQGAVLKFNSIGTLQWERLWCINECGTQGLPYYNRGDAVAVDSNDNIYITGYADNCPCQTGGSYVPILKFNSTGSLIWQKTLIGGGRDEGLGIAVSAAESVYVTGVTSSWTISDTGTGTYSGGVDAPGEYAFLLKLDLSGSPLQTLIYGPLGPSHLWGSAVAIDAYGGPIMVGAIGETPADMFGSMVGGNLTIQSTSSLLSNPNITAKTPTISTRSPSGQVETPLGTTKYAGLYDILILEASPLYLINFNITTIGYNATANPAGALCIVFNGTCYRSPNNGLYLGVYVDMVSSAEAGLYPSGGYGISFSHWETNGSISVSSSTDNPTTVTIQGPGSLTAVYLYNKSQSPVLDPLESGLIVGSSGVILAAILLFIRRRKMIASEPSSR